MIGEEQRRRELDYEEKRKEVIRFLESEDNAIMVLATAQDGRVLARNVLVVNDELDIYFFTWGYSSKCIQIQKNPRVALCKDNMQIEGVAEILGALLGEGNTEYTDIIRAKYPEAVKKWEQYPSMVIVRIRPTAIVIGASIDDEPYLDHMDLEKKIAYAERWADY